MSSSSKIAQWRSTYLQLLGELGAESAIKAMMSHAPDDPKHRHNFDCFMDVAKATHMSTSQNDSREHILVFVIHGIRDEGPWLDMIKSVLQSESITVQTTDFKRVGACRFLFRWRIDKIVNATKTKLFDAIDDAERKNDKLRVMAIGHSFGTYILLKVLEDTPTLKIERMIFCGSVAPREFRYDKLKNRPELLVNDCGARDIWPIVAESFGLSDYGAAGVFGLRGTNVVDRFHDFGHGGYLKKSFVEQFWKPFFTEGRVVPSEYTEDRRPIPLGVTLLGYGYKLIGLLGLIWFLPWFLRLTLKNRYDQISWIDFFAFFIPGLLVGRIVVDTIRFHFPPNRNKKDWKYSILFLVWIAIIIWSIRHYRG